MITTVLLFALIVLVAADLALGVWLWRRIEARMEKLERVGILVTPDPAMKDAPVPMRMTPRQKVRFIEQKLRKRAQILRGEA